MNIYSIYDKKSATYSLPFYAPSADVAIRCVINAMLDKKIDFYLHAEDYSVRFIGEFDQQTGFISCDDACIVTVKTCEELAIMADELRKKLETPSNE